MQIEWDPEDAEARHLEVHADGRLVVRVERVVAKSGKNPLVICYDTLLLARSASRTTSNFPKEEKVDVGFIFSRVQHVCVGEIALVPPKVLQHCMKHTPQ